MINIDLKGNVGIYCFTNTINNKKYIGQSINLKARIKTHYSSYKNPKYNHLALYKAFLKYGIENFQLEIIEYVEPIDNIKSYLDQLEIKYIKEYNSYSPNGYNMTKGGDAGVLGLKMTNKQKEKIKKGALLNAEKYKKPIYLYNILDRKSYSFNSVDDARTNLLQLYEDVPSAVNLRKLRNLSYGKYTCSNFIAAITEEELNNRITNYLSTHSCITDTRNKGRYIKGYKNVNKYRQVALINSNNHIIEIYDSVKFIPTIWGKSQDTIRRKIKNKISQDGKYLQYVDQLWKISQNKLEYLEFLLKMVKSIQVPLIIYKRKYLNQVDF